MLILCSLLVLAATYRGTVYALDDAIFQSPREWAKRKSRWVAKLVTCPWCMSTWLGAPLAGAVAVFVASGQRSDRIVFWLLLWWTASAFTGILHGVSHKPKPLHATLLRGNGDVHPIVLDGHPMHVVDMPAGAVVIGDAVFAPIPTTPNVLSGR